MRMTREQYSWRVGEVSVQHDTVTGEGRTWYGEFPLIVVNACFCRDAWTYEHPTSDSGSDEDYGLQGSTYCIVVHNTAQYTYCSGY